MRRRTVLHPARSMSPLLMLAVLAGCASPYLPAGSEVPSQGYRQVTATYRGTGGPTPISVFVRPFEAGDGRLGLCGYYVENAPESAREVIRAQFYDPAARLSLGGTDVGDLGFLRANRPGPAAAMRAGCVRTRLPWDARFADAPVAFFAPRKVVNYRDMVGPPLYSD